jgi:putative ABC transport system ATP-binding protein
MSLIQVIGLNKTYATGKNIITSALKDISLDFAEKDFCAIAGSSGSGKSSLLHLMGALDLPTSGKIMYDQNDITSMKADDLSNFRRDHIGFVFQAYNLITTLTAVENVEYIMLLQRVRAHERQQKAREILERIGLGNYLNRFPNEMSGGQQQRVAIARAMAAQPKVILADEPTANLDSKTANDLIDLMLELNAQKGMTFIFSTHDPLIINKAKRVVHLKDGKIVS